MILVAEKAAGPLQRGGVPEVLSSTNLGEDVEPGGAEDQSPDLSGSAEAGTTQRNAPYYHKHSEHVGLS